MTTLDLTGYRKVIVIGPQDREPTLREIGEADLVVYEATGRVMKDRHGIGRSLTDRELSEVKKLAAA
jgi:hypothetical protein